MGLELTVDLEAYEPGAMLGFAGLGLFENGATTELTDEQELAFVQFTGMSVRDSFADQEGITVKGRSKYSPDDLPEISDEVEITPPLDEDQEVEE